VESELLLDGALFRGFGQLKVSVVMVALGSCSVQQWLLLAKNENNQQRRGLKEGERETV
jgi:hypothetical protein